MSWYCKDYGSVNVINLDIFNANYFRYPEKISKVVAHAGQSYISETDMEKMMKVIDVSNWSARMREPMENIYGKVSNFEM